MCRGKFCQVGFNRLLSCLLGLSTIPPSVPLLTVSILHVVQFVNFMLHFTVMLFKNCFVCMSTVTQLIR